MQANLLKLKPIPMLQFLNSVKNFFKETEDLIAEAEKQPGTHTQVSKIKSKLNQSKQQILEMELATQIKSCDFALTKLNTLKQQ